jgi:hypothetical protein
VPQARKAPKRIETPPEKMAEAAAHEALIRDMAEDIRGDADELTPELFLALYPLLTEPIHEGYIETVTAGEGKPYDSTGVRSVQVQHDRMNAVLTPVWWDEVVTYFEEGKLCKVTVRVLRDDGKPVFERSSYGGVDRGSTRGNVYKGSYTNAAKVAFARVGPGHEVYVGAVDLDPDVSEQAAKAQAKPEQLPPVETIDAKGFGRLRDLIDLSLAELDGVGAKEFTDRLKTKFGAMGVAGVKSVNEAVAKLTPAQGAELEGWLAEGGTNGDR